jgi:hypothetical protein
MLLNELLHAKNAKLLSLHTLIQGKDQCACQLFRAFEPPLENTALLR